MADRLFDAIARSAKSPRASVSDWVGKTIRLTDGAFWSQFSERTSSSGQVVTVDKAMRLTAVWACVRLISETIATLPLGLYRREDDGGRSVASDHDLHWILRSSPNADMTSVQFWEAVVASLLLKGNAYVEIKRSLGRVVSLEFLLPQRVDVDLADNGALEYWYTPRKADRRRIADADMLHIRAFSLDGLIGLSPIAYGANVFGAAMAADEAASGTFNNGLMPTVAFKVDRVLKPDQRDEFRDYVRRLSGAMNAGRSPVLEQGVTAETIGINPTDAQLLESREFSAEDICRFYLIDPTMVGYGDKASNWGTGLEQKQIRFLTYTLRTYLRRIEEAVSKKLLRPEERRVVYPEFSIEGLLRADSAARAQFYSQMTQNGIYTRDDCRVRENLPRRGGNADVLTVQSNLAPLDQLGGGSERKLSAVEAVQKAYLGVGKMITADEARQLVNQHGAGLKVPGPDFEETQE